MNFKKITSTLVICTFLTGTLASGALAEKGGKSTEVKTVKTKTVTTTKSVTTTKVKNLKFKDMDTAKWAEKHISSMIAQDVVKGYGDGRFKPNKPVTQGEAVVMTMKMLGDIEQEDTVDGAVYFKNAASIPEWVYGPAITAANNGIIDVPANGNFQYNKPATREWVAKLIVKAFDIETEQTAALQFKDVDKISADIVPFVYAAYDKGILKGFPDKTFKPQKPVTRAEIVVMLQLADDLVDEQLTTPDISVLTNKFKGVVSETVTDDVYSITLDVKALDEDVTFTVNKDVEVYINDTKSDFTKIQKDSIAKIILDKETKEVIFIDVTQKSEELEVEQELEDEEQIKEKQEAASKTDKEQKGNKANNKVKDEE